MYVVQLHLVHKVIFLMAALFHQNIGSSKNVEKPFLNVCSSLINNTVSGVEANTKYYFNISLSKFRLQYIPLGCETEAIGNFLLATANNTQETFNDKPKSFSISEGVFEDISVGFLPDGTFFDGEYYFRNNGQYCVQTITQNQIEVQLCLPQKTDFSIPKCCRVDENLNYNGECEKLNPNISSIWTPKIYHAEDGYRGPLNYTDQLIRYYNTDLSKQCKSVSKSHIYNLTQPIFIASPVTVTGTEDVKLVLFEHHNKTTIKPLTFQYNKRKWILDTNVSFCVDTIDYNMEPEGTDAFQHRINSKDFMIILCYSDVISNTRPYNHHNERFKAYVKAITTLISAVFLLALVIFYVKSWAKHNLHARTLFMYFASMLGRYTFISTAQFIYLFPNPQFTGIGERGLVCMIVAIAAHYFYIASYVWMTVLNFDIVNTFRKLKISNSKINSTVLAKYCVVGWGVPLSFAACLVVLDFVFIDPLSEVPVPNYGTTSCFVNTHFRGEFVYFPMGILLVLNIPVMIWTQHIFCMARCRQAKELQDGISHKFNTESYTVKLFLKLFVVMGGSYLVQFFTWYYHSTRAKNETPWTVQFFENCSNLSPVCLFYIFCVNQNCLNSFTKFCKANK